MLQKISSKLSAFLCSKPKDSLKGRIQTEPSHTFNRKITCEFLLANGLRIDELVLATEYSVCYAGSFVNDSQAVFIECFQNIKAQQIDCAFNMVNEFLDHAVTWTHRHLSTYLCSLINPEGGEIYIVSTFKDRILKESIQTDEEQVKLYATHIVSSLNYLQSHGIVGVGCVERYPTFLDSKGRVKLCGYLSKHIEQIIRPFEKCKPKKSKGKRLRFSMREDLYDLRVLMLTLIGHTQCSKDCLDFIKQLETAKTYRQLFAHPFIEPVVKKTQNTVHRYDSPFAEKVLTDSCFVDVMKFVNASNVDSFRKQDNQNCSRKKINLSGNRQAVKDSFDVNSKYESFHCFTQSPIPHLAYSITHQLSSNKRTGKKQGRSVFKQMSDSELGSFNFNSINRTHSPSHPLKRRRISDSNAVSPKAMNSKNQSRANKKSVFHADLSNENIDTNRDAKPQFSLMAQLYEKSAQIKPAEPLKLNFDKATSQADNRQSQDDNVTSLNRVNNILFSFNGQNLENHAVPNEQVFGVSRFESFDSKKETLPLNPSAMEIKESKVTAYFQQFSDVQDLQRSNAKDKSNTSGRCFGALSLTHSTFNRPTASNRLKVTSDMQLPTFSKLMEKAMTERGMLVTNKADAYMKSTENLGQNSYRGSLKLNSNNAFSLQNFADNDMLIKADNGSGAFQGGQFKLQNAQKSELVKPTNAAVSTDIDTPITSKRTSDCQLSFSTSKKVPTTKAQISKPTKIFI